MPEDSLANARRVADEQLRELRREVDAEFGVRLEHPGWLALVLAFCLGLAVGMRRG